MHKRIFRTLVAVVLICSMLIIPAYAEGAYVSGSSVNVRSGPGTNYPVVDCLAKNSSVTVTNMSNSDWYAIEYNGKSGFMSSRYLSISDSSTSNVATGGDSGYINAMYVRFRSGASTSSTILGEYNTGKAVTITGSSGDWTACTIDGKAGYIFTQYVTKGSYGGSSSTKPAETYDPGYDDNSGIVIIDGAYSAPAATPVPTPTANTGDGNVIIAGPESTPTPTATPTPVPTPTASTGGSTIIGSPESTPTPTAVPTPVPTPTPTASTGGSVIIGSPESTPTPTAAPTPTPTPSPAPSIEPVTEKEGYINGDYVRFRSGPATSYSILGTYNKGKTLTITGISGDWTACKIDGVSGYVYSQYVKETSSNTTTPTPTPETPNTSSQAGYITGNNVRFRAGASLSSDIIGELFYGNNVTITGTSGDWTAITYNGKSGYVSSQYVKTGSYTPPTSTGGSALGREIADYALQFVGYNYTWGGKSPSTGFDCSGLMYYVYAQFGYSLNRVAADQAKNGVHVDPANLQPGDLLCFYSSGSYIGHVGMYIGDNKFVHAASSTTGVIITELSGYYATRGYEARRIV